MNIIRYGFAAMLTALLGASSISTGAGCGSCDAENRCLQKEGLLVQDEIYPICGVDATYEGDRYTWALDSGDCSCTLESGAIGGYNWRNCTFEPR